MISLTTVFTFLVIHWVADFILQTDQQAKGKSSSNYYLTAHVLTYSLVWMGFFIAEYSLKDGFAWTAQGWRFIFLFPAITFVCHWITDYFTSRLNTKLHKANRIHEFFVSVGFDQILHYVQLFLTYYFLMK